MYCIILNLKKNMYYKIQNKCASTKFSPNPCKTAVNTKYILNA